MADISAYQEHLDWIDSQHQHMVHLTMEWSKINSGSFHLEGLQRMADVLADNFLWLDGKMEQIPLPPLELIDDKGQAVEIPMGKALHVKKRPDAPIQIFLGGHMDTVFGKDHPFQAPTFLDENTLNGPGVADLKGGLVVMLKALEVLERSPFAENIGWEVLINPDEEIGSQCSDHLLAECAKRCQLGLIYEPALRDGTLAGSRKGSGNFTIVVKGRAAHAGREHHLGRNAIVACAKITAEIDALNGQREGVTINPGKIEGGGALNVVPDLAIMRFNVRMEAVEDQAWLEGKFAEILHVANEEDGISTAIHGKFTRAPKPIEPDNIKVFEMVKECGALLDQPIAWAPTGGCCDGNNLYKHGLPNVDTLGVCGGDIHSDKEFVLLDSLASRAKLSALILMRLGAGEIQLR